MTNLNQLPHSQIKTLWFQGVHNDPLAKEDLEKTLRNSAVAFNKLLEILEDRKRQLDTSEIREDYQSPSWSHKQAHRNGRRQELQDTIDLLTFIKG